MSRKDRLVFRRVVPRAARKARARAHRLRADAPRPARALRRAGREDRRDAERRRSRLHARATASHDYVLLVGAVQERKNPLAALAAAEAAGLPLVVAGPAKDEALARELERRGARVTGYVDQDELVRLYRGAACLVQPSRYEGFGLPVLEAMACGTPVVAVPEPALREVAGDAAVWAEERELGGRDPPRRRRARAARRGRARAGAAVLLARDGAADARGLPGGARPVKVSAVVVSHGHARELERSLPALAPQVDELVVVANLPGSVGGEHVRRPRASRTRGRVSFAANVNRGVAETSGELVVVSNPDAYPEPGAVAELARFADEHPRAGLVGPLVLWPDGTWQPSLRRFPTVLGTIWRRTPLRLLRDPYRPPGLALRHAARPSRCRATGCSAAPAC